MSKSLGNFVTINELLRTDKFGGRRWPGAVVKLAMIKNNYRQPIDWTVKALEDAAEEVAEWSARLDDPIVKMTLDNAKTSGVDISPYEEVIDVLSDDLNTADALAHIRSVARKITRGDAEARTRLLANLSFLGLINPDLLAAYRLGVTSLNISPRDAKQYERAVINIRTSIANNDLQAVSSIIGPYNSEPVTFEYKPETGSVFVRGTDTSINERIQLLVVARLEARKRKDFKESDRIRDELAKMGIALKDTKNKETGEIETTWEVTR
jgi:cysteinyl-tRNA synthetase